jgi:hypothetical protein
MVIRVAKAPGVSSDELLGIKPARTNGGLSLKITRRLIGIEDLPAALDTRSAALSS